MVLVHRAELIAEVEDGITRMKVENSSRKWLKFTDAFPTVPKSDTNVYVDALDWRNSPFKIQHRCDRGTYNSIPRFARSADIKPRAEKKYVPPPRVEFKLKKTRYELESYWARLINILNGILNRQDIPLRITSEKHYNLPVAIKYCKRQVGITIDEIISCSAGRGYAEHERILKALWRSPAKYSIYSDAELLAMEVERAEVLAYNERVEAERIARLEAEKQRTALDQHLAQKND